MISIVVGNYGDLGRADFERLIDVVAAANKAADCKDEQLQRIETTLDLALMALEKEERGWEEAGE